MKGIFITGTDTGVGKTYFTALLTRALRKRSVPAIPLKPISAGDRTDSILLSEATGGAISPIEINPVHFSAPLSPYAASMVEGRPFPWGILRERTEKLAQNYQGPFLVEGAGGWRVPLDSSLGIREWAQELSLPVVVVARNSLGTLNHTLLTVDSIRQSNLPLLGVVLNDTTPKPDDSSITNPAVLEQLTRLPVLSLAYQSTQLPSLPAWLTPL
ncbi:MAG: dethiobiotin synthase [Verrucomicrobia bacterium]|jgi:dethiobiotin synthetase|nr:dethiobiotin synthase [Verrucomicrobiota bacterium]